MNQYTQFDSNFPEFSRFNQQSRIHQLLKQSKRGSQNRYRYSYIKSNNQNEINELNQYPQKNQSKINHFKRSCNSIFNNKKANIPKPHNKSISTNVGSNIHVSRTYNNGSRIHHHAQQSQILQLQKTLNNQKFQIQSLNQQMNFYQSTCEKNKNLLQELYSNKDLITHQYEQQIQSLISERQNLNEIISTVTQQYQLKLNQQQATIHQKRQYNIQKSKDINEHLNIKEQYLDMIKKIDEELKIKQNAIDQQEQKLDGLRNIQRKFYIAVKELQRLKKQIQQ